MKKTLATIALAAAMAGCAEDAPTEPGPLSAAEGSRAYSAEENRQLAEIRRATARFHRVEEALAAGYVPTPECAAIPGVGGMGIHYIHPGLLGLTAPVNGRVAGTDAEIDPLRPEILMYEPQEGGHLRLAGVEYLVFREAWEAAGNTEAPTFLGRTFDYMEDDPSTPVDEAHEFTPHYDQHVWLWKDNPAGMLEPWNPAVSCPEGEHH